MLLDVSWDGALCRSIYCGCTGEDCDRLYLSEEACVAAGSGCMAACPDSEWPIVLTQEDEGCLCGKEHYLHCCPDGMEFCACEAGSTRYEEHLLCGESD